jgi:hypothetical protein
MDGQGSPHHVLEALVVRGVKEDLRLQLPPGVPVVHDLPAAPLVPAPAAPDLAEDVNPQPSEGAAMRPHGNEPRGLLSELSRFHQAPALLRACGQVQQSSLWFRRSSRPLMSPQKDNKAG